MNRAKRKRMMGGDWSKGSNDPNHRLPFFRDERSGSRKEMCKSIKLGLGKKNPGFRWGIGGEIKLGFSDKNSCGQKEQNEGGASGRSGGITQIIRRAGSATRVSGKVLQKM